MGPMRWNRILKSSLLMTAIAAVAIGYAPASSWIRSELERRAQQPDPILATPDETHAIIEAVVQRMDYEGLPPPPPEAGASLPPKTRQVLMVVDRSMCFGESMANLGCGSGAAELVRSLELDAFTSRKFREELVLANRTPGPLALSDLRGAQVMRSSEIPDKGDAWDDFHRRHPDSSGYALVTRPVLSEDRRHALVYISHRCAFSCGSSSLLLLDRTDLGWRVAGVELLTMT